MPLDGLEKRTVYRGTIYLREKDFIFPKKKYQTPMLVSMKFIQQRLPKDLPSSIFETWMTEPRLHEELLARVGVETAQGVPNAFSHLVSCSTTIVQALGFGPS